MSQVVGGEGRGRRASNGVLCLVLLGLTLGALGHVAVQARKVEVALELGREQAQHLSLLSERRHLDLELGKLRDPARLVKIAREKLNMAEPAPGDIRVLARSAAKEATP